MPFILYQLPDAPPALFGDRRGPRPRGGRVLTPGGPSNRYSFGFLGVSLRPDLARVVAEVFLEEGSWEATRSRVLATNALQCRSRLSLRRMEQELRWSHSGRSSAELPHQHHAVTPSPAAGERDAGGT
jgi:hypothetical protein